MRVALIGTRGVPAHYGGFETAVEEVGRRLVDRGHEVVVFCRPVGGETSAEQYLGMRLVHLPALRHPAVETLSHTALSVVSPHLKDVDAAIVFNAANSPLLPVLRARGIPVATHVDGLEWKRGKWGPVGRDYYRLAEALSVRWSDALIADARGIADYYTEEFAAPTREIAYGAPLITGAASDKLAGLGLQPRGYHLVVARFEVENHVLEAVEGYARSSATAPLVVVGSAPYSHGYVASVREAAQRDSRIRLVGGIWDNDLLDQLYAHCLSYVHGHSVGGTNPSLLRAAGAGAHVIAWDVAFNREVIGPHGQLFSSPATLAEGVEWAEAHPQEARADGEGLQRDIARYSWDDVADQYARLLTDLARGGPTPRTARPSGARREGTLAASAATVGLRMLERVPHAAVRVMRTLIDRSTSGALP
ncbi:DUF1972 domain-containing protein [Aestuariimicrobium kwangyangense]|uniref:DUF1972 domain-containing protein n=1 Tax=Aestuariimicrobium kwangyangense TaxID=396389 RepID=UPI0003B3A9BD|nr:DUF1972 domain-containing protein [Aestuariimicrobium kwangyangense]